MNFKRLITVCLLFVSISCVLISCKSEPADPYEPEQDYLGYPEKVDELPECYLSLDDALAEGGEIMTYEFWETHLFILDEEGDTIYNAPIYKGGLIVDYQGTYYINGVRHDAALAEAMARSEELNREYAPGETVPLRRASCRYSAVIDAVEQDRFTVHLKKNDPYNPDYSIEQFLGHIETTKGKTITTFSVDDSGTVSAVLDAGDQIKRIVLTIPESNLTRVIVVP